MRCQAFKGSCGQMAFVCSCMAFFCLSATNSFAQSDDKIKADLGIARATCDAAVKKAKQITLEALNAKELSSAKKGDYNEIKTIKALKLSLENDKTLIPSPLTREIAKKYEANVVAAKSKLFRSIEIAKSEYTKLFLFDQAEILDKESKILEIEIAKVKSPGIISSQERWADDAQPGSIWKGVRINTDGPAPESRECTVKILERQGSKISGKIFVSNNQGGGQEHSFVWETDGINLQGGEVGKGQYRMNFRGVIGDKKIQYQFIGPGIEGNIRQGHGELFKQ